MKPHVAICRHQLSSSEGSGPLYGIPEIPVTSVSQYVILVGGRRQVPVDLVVQTYILLMHDHVVFFGIYRANSTIANEIRQISGTR